MPKELKGLEKTQQASQKGAKAIRVKKPKTAKFRAVKNATVQAPKLSFKADTRTEFERESAKLKRKNAYKQTRAKRRLLKAELKQAEAQQRERDAYADKREIIEYRIDQILSEAIHRSSFNHVYNQQGQGSDIINLANVWNDFKNETSDVSFVDLLTEEDEEDIARALDRIEWLLYHAIQKGNADAYGELMNTFMKRVSPNEERKTVEKLGFVNADGEYRLMTREEAKEQLDESWALYEET